MSKFYSANLVVSLASLWRRKFPQAFSAIFFLALHSFSPSAFAADALSETQAAVQEWVHTEQLISQEHREWREERATIENILTILAAERQELNAQITLAQQVASRADEERAELVARLSDYEQTSSVLNERVSDYERQLLLLENYLPTLLREELAPRFNRIRQTGSEIELSLSERAQAVFAALAAINNFDSQLTLTSEVLTEVQSQPMEVQVLYFGLSRAFFVNENQTVAGFGIPQDGGWHWTMANEEAARIAQALAVFETRVSPQLIELPMELHTELPAGARQ